MNEEPSTKWRPGDVRHSLASVEILREKLGLRDLVSFQAGLGTLIRSTGD